MRNRLAGKHCLRRVREVVFKAAGLALVLALAFPARAADDRAVKMRVAPVYPELAKRMKIYGEVKLEATVNADGKVTGVKPISGTNVLVVAAEEAVRKWKFASGPGVSQVNVTVNFAMNQ